VFTTLGARSMTSAELGRVLTLHPRGIYDFFDTLVAWFSRARWQRWVSTTIRHVSPDSNSCNFTKIVQPYRCGDSDGCQSDS
jgi:hypothetical protein